MTANVLDFKKTTQTCRFCGFNSVKHRQRKELHITVCSEHNLQVCPNCGTCPTVRTTPRRVAIARQRAAYKTWD